MKSTRRRRIGIVVTAALAAAVLLAGCDSAGAGGSSSGGGGTSSCTGTGDYTVEWRFSGSYSDTVTVTMTWFNSGGASDITDPGSVTAADPTDGTLNTEMLPGCTGVSINLVANDEFSDDDDLVDLDGVTLSIVVEGAVADSVDLDGTVADGSILPSAAGLTVVVGQ